MTIRRFARASVLILLALLATAALAIELGGGMVWHWGQLRISARHARNPAIAAFLMAAAAWALSSRAERRRAVAFAVGCARAECGPLHLIRSTPERLAPIVAAAAAAAVVLFALQSGAFAVGGSDAYGYVSQAELWTRGRLIVEQPFARDLQWPNAAGTLSPLGYRPHHHPSRSTDLVPIYAPGLPMVMAVFQLVGGRPAVFLVVPLLGGLAVWATYVMGRRLAGSPLVGMSAAVLLAVSPSFLLEVTAPTSDAPLTAWWACVFALLLVPGRRAAVCAGLAASLAILTRPNIAPVWVAVAGFLIPYGLRLRHSEARRRLLLFAASAAPGAILLAIINAYLYGSPLGSGYGPLSSLFKLDHFPGNVAAYPRWLVETHTPFIILAFAAPVLLRQRRAETGGGPAHLVAAMWLSFAVIIFACYVFFEPLRGWGYLRYVLPGLPGLLVLSTITLREAVAPAARVARILPPLASLVVVAVVAIYCVNYAADSGLATAWRREQRFVEAGEYIKAKLPERAALLSMEHSGSARYYSGRLTVRYDLIPPTQLDSVIGELRRLQYHPYFLFDDWEEPLFTKRFAGHSALAALDWWPVALLHHKHVRIYDPADRQRPVTSATR